MDKAKSRRIVKVVLIFAALLGLASIATAYWFFQIRDVTPSETAAAKGCGCYFVMAPSGVSSCSQVDPKMAFEFRNGIVQENGTCSAKCETKSFASISKESTTAQEPDVIACNAPDFPINPGCIDLSIEDNDGSRVATSVSPTGAKKVKAVFNIPSTLSSTEGDFYSSFSFLINGERKNVELIDAVKRGSGADMEYVVSADIDDYSSADKLLVQAFGSSVVGTEFTSQACLREITVSQEQAPSCSALDLTVQTAQVGTTTKVSEVTMETSGISSLTTLSAVFTVGSGNTILTTKDISSNYLSGTILLNEDFLYNSENFTQGQSFSVLDTETTKIDVSVKLVVNGEEIDSAACLASERIESDSPSDDPDPQPTDPSDDDDKEPEDTDDDDEQTGGSTTTSNFTVGKGSSLQCVERTTPNNVLVQTITVSNADTDTEIVSSVVEKLPLGFTYVASSTRINGVAVADSGTVEVATVGNAVQITWEKNDGWAMTAGSKMTIEYKTMVNASALSGDNLAETVVVPVNTPANPSSVRTENSIRVAQSCGAPETSMFDSTIARIALGAIIILTGAAFYASSLGYSLSTKVANNSVSQSIYSTLQMLGWKINNPRKFFEERSISRIEKKRRSTRS